MFTVCSASAKARHRSRSACVCCDADARRVLVPEIGEHVADRAGDVVAVLLVLVETLDPDAARIGERRTSACRRSFRATQCCTAACPPGQAREDARTPGRCCATRRTCAGSPLSVAARDVNVAARPRGLEERGAQRVEQRRLRLGRACCGSSSSVSAMRQMRYAHRTAFPRSPGSRRMLSAKVRETAGRISRQKSFGLLGS